MSVTQFCFVFYGVLPLVISELLLLSPVYKRLY